MIAKKRHPDSRKSPARAGSVKKNICTIGHHQASPATLAGKQKETSEDRPPETRACQTGTRMKGNPGKIFNKKRYSGNRTPLARMEATRGKESRKE